MDGTLSGAILTGCGRCRSHLLGALQFELAAELYNPHGIHAALESRAPRGVAPYTVTTGGVQYDNSPSRLNVAKAGITSILNNYIADADFALMDYQTSGLNSWTTWVYQMSPAGGFQFTNTATPPTRRRAGPEPLLSG